MTANSFVKNIYSAILTLQLHNEKLLMRLEIELKMSDLGYKLDNKLQNLYYTINLFECFFTGESVIDGNCLDLTRHKDRFSEHESIS